MSVLLTKRETKEYAVFYGDFHVKEYSGSVVKSYDSENILRHSRNGEF
jgi:hypothetical protein